MLKKVLLGFLGLILVTVLAFFIEFKDVILSNETTEEIEQKIGRNEEEFQAKVDAIINEDKDEAEESQKNDSKEAETSKEVPGQKQETEQKEEVKKESQVKRSKEEEPKRIQVIEDEAKDQAEPEIQAAVQEEAVEEEVLEAKRTKGEIISDYKDRLQQVQGLYNSKINSMVSKAKGEYKALSEEEKTVSNKVDIGMKYLDIALGLEDECDGVVYGLIADMENELTQNEYSTEIISVVKEYYENEKSMRKEYYKSKLD